MNQEKSQTPSEYISLPDDMTRKFRAKLHSSKVTEEVFPKNSFEKLEEDSAKLVVRLAFDSFLNQELSLRKLFENSLAIMAEKTLHDKIAHYQTSGIFVVGEKFLVRNVGIDIDEYQKFCFAYEIKVDLSVHRRKD